MTTPKRRLSRPSPSGFGQRLARIRAEVAAWRAWQTTVRNQYPHRVPVIDRAAEKDGR